VQEKDLLPRDLCPCFQELLVTDLNRQDVTDEGLKPALAKGQLILFTESRGKGSS
jgi:hypothetical protein